jgi:hypothetical protein
MYIDCPHTDLNMEPPVGNSGKTQHNKRTLCYSATDIRPSNILFKNGLNRLKIGIVASCMNTVMNLKIVEIFQNIKLA